MAVGWTGVIEEYRSFLPVRRDTPGRHAARGRDAAGPRTPAVRARRRASVWLKVEGANPTGSFKDRGMTMAISKAVEEGAKAVVCASTGNTSASAAAYAARAGLTCVVLIPEGHIALGKLAQALVHGARVLQVRGNFDQLLDHRPRACRTTRRSPWSTRSTRTASRARRPAHSRSSTCSGDAPDVHCIPVGNAGNITAYWRGYLRVPGGRACHASCRGCSASRRPARRRSSLGHPVENPETIATAIRIGNPASWYAATAAASESGGSITAVTDEEILGAYRSWPSRNRSSARRRRRHRSPA